LSYHAPHKWRMTFFCAPLPVHASTTASLQCFWANGFAKGYLALTPRPPTAEVANGAKLLIVDMCTKWYGHSVRLLRTATAWKQPALVNHWLFRWSTSIKHLLEMDQNLMHIQMDGGKGEGGGAIVSAERRSPGRGCLGGGGVSSGDGSNELINLCTLTGQGRSKGGRGGGVLFT